MSITLEGICHYTHSHKGQTQSTQWANRISSIGSGLYQVLEKIPHCNGYYSSNVRMY